MHRRFLTLAAAIVIVLVTAADSRAGFQVYVANAHETGGNGGNTLDAFSSTGTHLGAFPNVNPWGVAVSPSGNVYATTASATFTGINVFSPSGSLLTSFAVNTNGTSGLAFDSTGNLLVSVFGGEIERFSPTGVDLGTFASGYSATFLTVGPNGDVYASDGTGNILWFSKSGQLLGSVENWGASAGLAFDAAGNLDQVATSAGANTGVYQFTPTLSYLGAVVSPGTLVAPEGIAVAPNGDLLVADIGLNSGIIRQFSPTGADLGIFASGLDDPIGIAIGVGVSVVPEPSAFVMALCALPLLAGLVRAAHRDGSSQFLVRQSVVNSRGGD